MKPTILIPTVLAVNALFGSVSSVQAAPVKLVCKGPVTVEADTEKLREPNMVSVELDQAAEWVTFEGWLGDMVPNWPKDYWERLPITSSGTTVMFTNTVPGPGVVSITTGRIELSTGRMYFTTTSSSPKGAGEQWTPIWGGRLTTLTVTGDVPCRTP